MGTRRGNNESWVSETPNGEGYYEAFVSMGTKPNGKPDRRHVKRRSLAAVRRRVRELERDRDAGRITKAGAKIPTVRAMLERHLAVILPSRNRAPRTIDDYRSKCRNDIFPRWGGQRADRLLPEHIEEGLAEMLAEGHAPSHVRKVYAILSSAYQVQVDRGNLRRNPCEHVDPPELGEAEILSLTQDEAVTVLEAAAGRPNSARWLIGLGHGLRQGEALGLRWDYLNLDTGQLRAWWQLQRLTWRHGCAEEKIRALSKAGASADEKDRARQELEHSCARRYCKTRPCAPACRKHARRCPDPCEPDCTGHARKCGERRGGGLVFREIKERRRKTIWLDPAFCALLRDHYEAQVLAAAAAGDEWDDHGLVFCQWNGKPIDPRRDWQEWGEILQASGLPSHRLHALRHSAASLLGEGGVPTSVIQKMLGHSDIRITERYMHVQEAQMKEASGHMARILKLPVPDETATGTATGRDDRES
jgi:integrase